MRLLLIYYSTVPQLEHDFERLLSENFKHICKQVEVCQELMIVVMLHVAHMESFLRVLDVFVVPLLEWLVSKRVVK